MSGAIKKRGGLKKRHSLNSESRAPARNVNVGTTSELARETVSDNVETQEQIIERLKVKTSPSEIQIFRPQPPPFPYPPDINLPDPRSRYKRTKRHVKVLKTSMRFVPQWNNAPNEQGDPSDPPYLFRVKGRNLSFASDAPPKAAKTDLDPVRCIPRPPPLEDETSYDIVTLEWPINAKQLLKRVHQQLMVAYMDYYNKASAAHKLAEQVPVMYGIGRKRFSEDRQSRKINERKYEPPEDYDGPIPFFPDIETLLNRSIEGVPGYLDSVGIFHAADLGDALPNDALIGYKDSNGIFQNMMSVAEGVTLGGISVRRPQRNTIGLFGETLSQFGIDTSAGRVKIVGEQLPEPKRKPKSVLVKSEEHDGEEVPVELEMEKLMSPEEDKQKSKGRESQSLKRQSQSEKRPSRNVEKRLSKMTPGYIDDANNFHHFLDQDEELPEGAIGAYRSNSGAIYSVDGSPISELNSAAKVNPKKSDKVTTDEAQDEIFPDPYSKGEESILGEYKTKKRSRLSKRVEEKGHGNVVTIEETGLSDEELLQTLPPGSLLGYLDQDSKFIELFKGDVMPSGAQRAYLTW